MAVESATTITGLNAAWPLGTDSKDEGDNHIRLTKQVLQNHFTTGTAVDKVVCGGNITANNSFISSTNASILATTGAGTVFLRPNGAGSTTGQMTVDASGNTIAAGSVTSTTGVFMSAATGAILAPNVASGFVYLRPNGPASAGGQVSVGTDGIVHIAAGALAGDTTNLLIGATGGGAIYLRPNGVSSTSLQGYYDSNGNFVIAGPTGVKSTGTTWANPSDARLKQVIGPYEGGLAEINQIEPVIYQLLAHPEYGDQIGIVGQDIQEVMPETITLVEGEIVNARGEVETVPDLRQFDANAIIFALINACKELSARVAALEGV